MDDALRAALEAYPLVDITTRGRKSGDARRIEMPLRLREGRIFISGRPGKRSWYANILASPEVTIHVKRGATGDIPARGRAITDRAEKRSVLALFTPPESLEAWVEGSPLVELTES
jgi:deazaflavin-dependent oxidoreductase (nitroreductase family)